MRAVYAHFPINIITSKGGSVVEIKNFLGQKQAREVNMRRMEAYGCKFGVLVGTRRMEAYEHKFGVLVVYQQIVHIWLPVRIANG